jgi:hypothetical protein
MSTTLSPAHRQIRQNVRNFLLIATMDELKVELTIGDPVRQSFVQELIDERTMTIGQLSIGRKFQVAEMPVKTVYRKVTETHWCKASDNKSEELGYCCSPITALPQGADTIVYES